MAAKSILIITYYWPPSGGSGVQRWLKFVKYLPALGWTPYVFTPENPQVATRDESLLSDVPPEAEVIRLPIWEPYWRFQRGARESGINGDSKMHLTSAPGLVGRLVIWIRGNLLIPDPRRFWVRSSVAFLKDFLIEKHIQTIITTGPPHSLHLIGLRLKRAHPHLHWIADFRDPWSTWGLLESLKAGRLAMSMHRRLEGMVLRRATAVVTVTPFYKRQLEGLGGRPVHCLPNGFDAEDFTNFTWRRPERFAVRHIGIINERCDPRPFMKVLRQKCLEDATFHSKVLMEFIGDVHPGFQNFVRSDEVLDRISVFTPYIPHGEVLQRYEGSAVHLLVLNGYKDAEGYLPGKLFEYLAAGVPVLGTGPAHGDAGVLLHETKLGEMVEADDEKGIRSLLDRYYEWWQSGDPLPLVTHKDHYSRQFLTKELSHLLKQ